MNSVTCSSEKHAQTVSCAQTFIADEGGFECPCRQLDPLFVLLTEGVFLSLQGSDKLVNYIAGFVFSSVIERSSVCRILRVLVS